MFFQAYTQTCTKYGFTFPTNPTSRHTTGFSECSHPWSTHGGGTARTENVPKCAANDEPDDEINEPKHTLNTWITERVYRNQQNKIRKQPISIVFNYSSIILTIPMVKLLNRGLNFAIFPLNLDITQVIVDFKRFERSFIWKEFWYERESEEPYEKQMFKTNKSNYPKNYKIPNGVKTFVSSVKSELLDYKNRNKAKCNLPKEEIEALSQLIKLQKERKIMIKPCDKGAGVIILDFMEYMRSCKQHLESEQKDDNGQSNRYYIEVDEKVLKDAKHKITMLLEQGIDNNIITKQEFEAMNPAAKHVGKFYCNFKVHKQHTSNVAPPERPIVSTCGSITENIEKICPALFTPTNKQP